MVRLISCILMEWKRRIDSSNALKYCSNAQVTSTDWRRKKNQVWRYLLEISNRSFSGFFLDQTLSIVVIGVFIHWLFQLRLAIFETVAKKFRLLNNNVRKLPRNQHERIFRTLPPASAFCARNCAKTSSRPSISSALFSELNRRFSSSRSAS